MITIMMMIFDLFVVRFFNVFLMEEQITHIYSLLDTLQESTQILQSVVNCNHQYYSVLFFDK